MRTTSVLDTLFAAAALSASAISPASAQRAVAADYIRPVVNVASAADARLVRTLAVYELDATFEGMPTRVTVADSAGTLVASFRLRGSRTERPMQVGVADSDILLQGETPRGMLTMVLYEQNDPAGTGSLVGTWALGSRQGQLRGR